MDYLAFEEEFNRLSSIETLQNVCDSYFIFDQNSNFLFLIDTGACKSLVPSQCFIPEIPSTDHRT